MNTPELTCEQEKARERNKDRKCKAKCDANKTKTQVTYSLLLAGNVVQGEFKKTASCCDSIENLCQQKNHYVQLTGNYRCPNMPKR